jgi:hypothetical protein
MSSSGTVVQPTSLALHQAPGKAVLLRLLAFVQLSAERQLPMRQLPALHPPWHLLGQASQRGPASIRQHCHTLLGQVACGLDQLCFIVGYSCSILGLASPIPQTQ